jgi:hypothetical protein
LTIDEKQLVLCTHEEETDALHSLPAAVDYNADPEKSITFSEDVLITEFWRK